MLTKNKKINRIHSIEILDQKEVLQLAYEDAEVFFEALDHPPKPNQKLKKAVREFKRSGLYVSIES